MAYTFDFKLMLIRLFWLGVLLLGLLLGSCGATAKTDIPTKAEFKTAQEQAAKNTAAIKGNRNAITTIHQQIAINETTMNTKIQTETDALNDSIEAKITKMTGDIKQTTNNVWPWMILAIAQPLLFFAFLFFSRSYTGFGRI